MDATRKTGCAGKGGLLWCGKSSRGLAGWTYRDCKGGGSPATGLKSRTFLRGGGTLRNLGVHIRHPDLPPCGLLYPVEGAYTGVFHSPVDDPGDGRLTYSGEKRELHLREVRFFEV